MRDPSLRLLVLLVSTPLAIAALVLGVPVLDSYLDDLSSSFEGFGAVTPGVGEVSDWLVKIVLLAILLVFLVHLRQRAAGKARTGSGWNEPRGRPHGWGVPVD